MTPTAEESSSSSDGCVAKQTISNLRKILDEQRLLEDSKSVGSSSTSATAKIMKPAPMPLTPPPAPVFGTSTATASISRMLTKKVHHSSTRPPSPPRLSAMKGSRPATPSSITAMSSGHTSPTVMGATFGLPERLTLGLGSKSASSSGRSTPKRISFAELPEAHISSRPDKFRDKKRKGKGKEKAEDVEDSLGKGWFTTLFGGAGGSMGAGMGAGAGMGGLAYAEDRISRSWGGRGSGGGGYGYPDEWAA